MLNGFPQFNAGATGLMGLFLAMSIVAALIATMASWHFVANFSIGGTSNTIDAGLAILGFLLRKVWMASSPHMLALYNTIGGGAACVTGALVIAGSGAAGPACLPALTGALTGGVAMYGSIVGWTKLDRPDGAHMPVVISAYNALAGFAIALEGVAIRNTALMVAGLIVGTGRALMTLPMMNVQAPALSIGVAGRRILF